MTKQELIELCSLGESTTVQYKLEFTTQKQIAEELVAFANTRGGIIVFGAEDKTGKMVGLTYEQVQYTSRELGNTANEQVRPVIYIETETVKHEGMAYLIAYIKNGAYKPYKDLATQKSEITTRKPLNATQKKILKYLNNYPKATRKDVAQALGSITEDGVKFNIGLLQQYGALKRKGGRKNGEWVVNPDYISEL